MDVAATEVAILRFATSELPERDRLPWLREVIGRKIVKLDIEPAPDHELDAKLCLVPDIRAALACCVSPSRCSRTNEMVADGNDDLSLLVNLQGRCKVSQRDREVHLDAGDAAIFSHAEPGTITHGPTRLRSVVIPRAALASLVADLDDAPARLVPRDNEALRLLVTYLDSIQSLALAGPELLQLIGTHIDDLAALAIGATRDGAAIAAGRGMRAARLKAINDDIRANLCNHDLTVAAVALRQRITPRYIHKLFEFEGISFSQYVLGARLARAHRMLTDPRQASETISAIAYRTGFGDLSHFNRAFRRRYSASPSEVRAAAIAAA